MNVIFFAQEFLKKLFDFFFFEIHLVLNGPYYVGAEVADNLLNTISNNNNLRFLKKCFVNKANTG